MLKRTAIRRNRFLHGDLKTQNALPALLIILLFQVLLGSQESLVFLICDSLVYPNTALSRVMLSAGVDGLGMPFLAYSLPFLQAYPVARGRKKRSEQGPSA